MRPKTLLEIAGATPTPARLGNAAVVVIDAQQEYVDGMLALPGVGPALAEIGRLLARARAASTPIIHIVHHGKPGGPFAPESAGAEIASRLPVISADAIDPASPGTAARMRLSIASRIRSMKVA